MNVQTFRSHDSSARNSNSTTNICALCHLLFPEAEAAAEGAREAEAARLAAEGHGEGDLGELLAGVVDIVVMDAPRTLYEPRRKLPWGPAPTTGLTVAGSGERCRGGIMCSSGGRCAS